MQTDSPFEPAATPGRKPYRFPPGLYHLCVQKVDVQSAPGAGILRRVVKLVFAVFCAGPAGRLVRCAQDRIAEFVILVLTKEGTWEPLDEDRPLLAALGAPQSLKHADDVEEILSGHWIEGRPGPGTLRVVLGVAELACHGEVTSDVTSTSRRPVTIDRVAASRPPIAVVMGFDHGSPASLRDRAVPRPRERGPTLRPEDRRGDSPRGQRGSSGGAVPGGPRCLAPGQAERPGRPRGVVPSEIRQEKCARFLLG
jgi:hypothetical protein